MFLQAVKLLRADSANVFEIHALNLYKLALKDQRFYAFSFFHSLSLISLKMFKENVIKGKIYFFGTNMSIQALHA